MNINLNYNIACQSHPSLIKRLSSCLLLLLFFTYMPRWMFLLRFLELKIYQNFSSPDNFRIDVGKWRQSLRLKKKCNLSNPQCKHGSKSNYSSILRVCVKKNDLCYRFRLLINPIIHFFHSLFIFQLGIYAVAFFANFSSCIDKHCVGFFQFSGLHVSFFPL